MKVKHELILYLEMLVVYYYTSCPNTFPGQSNPILKVNNKYMPFKQDLNRAESKLRTAVTLYNDNLVRMSQSIMDEQEIMKYNFTESILSIETILDSIRSLIKCDQTSASYKSAVNYLCYNSMYITYIFSI